MPSITVKGMRCGHCSKSVTEAVSKLPGISSVEVSLEKGEVSWKDADPSSPVPVDTVKKTVNSIGFEAP